MTSMMITYTPAPEGAATGSDGGDRHHPQGGVEAVGPKLPDDPQADARVEAFFARMIWSPGDRYANAN
jgi:hypothetical protein